MQDFLFSFISSLLLVLAVSLDSFAACFAYGTSKIKIPPISIIIIAGINALMLSLSLLLGFVIAPLFPSYLPKIISFIILFIIGIVKLFDGIMKSRIKRGKKMDKRLKFSLFNLHFILNIYADPLDADKDNSKDLSPIESISLAIALSIDGIAVGFGAALTQVDIFIVVMLAIILGVLAIILGSRLGEKVSNNIPFDLSFIGGIFLIILALFKL